MNEDLEQKKSSELNEEITPIGRGFFASAALFFLEVIKVVVLAAITIIAVRTFLFKPFVVEGQSMEPNYFEKEYLLIDELSYHLRAPERGEVVVLRAPVIKQEYYLKRVLGLPGEKIKIESGKVIVFNDEFPQGKVVEENYLDQSTSGSTTVQLGPDEYFVMGDNRGESYDSRKFGPISKNSIIGRTWIRGFPFNRVTLFHAPTYNL
ncbi:MAG: signal peptidase I [Candidatus Magasanikbacteria bacterium RIFCSPHIGHO2_02_FULL_41_13]|uniref:Signal peptidase I n=1 Tax=Candidatus Magasanikbacteria bacterium RIFCSPHIGHO2_02_FULL_41_13 TaxID=1798676 RepID=A0A1F6M3Z8_9BACT|nr:MAG: signal peptidase I [Candidatus Magasanikbacteria bacterium RIFCSPHIGHO2_02_FULL_41_13]